MYQVLWSTSQPHKGHSAGELLWQYLVKIQWKLQLYELMLYETMVAKIPVCKVTTVRAGWYRVSFTAGVRDVAPLQNVQTGPALGPTKPIPHVPRNFFLSGRLNGQGIRFTTHFHLMLRLWISPIILKLTPKSLQGMNRGEFTFTLFSSDDGFCPPLPKRQKTQHPASTDFHNWCFYFAINKFSH